MCRVVVWLSVSICLNTSALQENRAGLAIIPRSGAALTVDAALWREHCADCVLFGADETQTTHVCMDESCARLLDMVMVRLQRGELYDGLIDELSSNSSIVSLFEWLYKHQVLLRTDPLFHVIAQAYVRKMVRDMLCGDSMLNSPVKLCAYIESRYADIAACLNLYVYASLPRAERARHSIALLQYVDIETAMAQLPADASVVQFVQPDELTGNFSRIKDMEPTRIVELADRTGHLPFFYYGRRFVGCVRNLLFSGYLGCDVLWACMLQDVARLKEILKSGVSVLHVLDDTVDPLAVRILRWCPREHPVQKSDSETDAYHIVYPPDPILDEICRLVLVQAFNEDEEVLKEFFWKYPELVNRALEVMPELGVLLAHDSSGYDSTK